MRRVDLGFSAAGGPGGVDRLGGASRCRVLVNPLKEDAPPRPGPHDEQPEWSDVDAAPLLDFRVAGDRDFNVVLARLCEVLAVDGMAAWGALAEPFGLRRAFAYSYVPIPRVGADADERPHRIWRAGPGQVGEVDGGAHLERVARHFRPDGLEYPHELRIMERDWKPLLAWCGIFQSHAFSERQRRQFHLLGPALGRRMIFEYELLRSETATAFLAAALDAVAAPSFLLDQQGYVLRFNAAGGKLIESNAAQVARDLRSAIKGDTCHYVVSKLFPSSSSLLHFALVRVAPLDDLGQRLALAAARWELTPRQSEVLSRLVLGESNKSIATHFHCAENTIELHVTRLLRRSGAESRTALVVTFWRM